MVTLPDCCFYPRWVPTSQKTDTKRAWKCYNCWEVKWMPLDFKFDRKMSEKISESVDKQAQICGEYEYA